MGGGITEGEVGLDSWGMAAQGADSALIIDPFGDFEEDVDGDESNAYRLYRDVLNNVFDHFYIETTVTSKM